MKKKDTKPSSMLSLALYLSYNFSAIPITFGISIAAIEVGYSVKIVKTHSSEIIIFTQIIVALILTSFLINRHIEYLLSAGWKTKLIKLLIAGLKWTIPILLLHSISLSIPTIRQNLINNYSSIDIINVNSASSLALFLFSILLIICAVFEEFFYRGIVLKILCEHMNIVLSVGISAIIFSLSHFIFSEFEIGRFVSSVIVGLLSGLAYISTGSCISAIVPHLLNNIICACFLWMVS